MTYYTLLENKVPAFGESWTYVPEEENLRWFFDIAAESYEDRDTIDVILREAPVVRRHIGTLFQEHQEYKCDPQLIKWLIVIAIDYDFKARTLFLALNILHRTYHKITHEFLTIYGCVIMNLAQSVTVKNEVLDVDIWDAIYTTYGCMCDNFKNKYEQIEIEVLDLLNGIISTLTYWDYAKSKDDLLDYINGNPRRHINQKIMSNKCI